MNAAMATQIVPLTASNFRGHFMCVPSLFPRGLPIPPRCLSLKWHLKVPARHLTRHCSRGRLYNADSSHRFLSVRRYSCGGLAFAAPPGQIRVEVNLVNLFATVRDKHKGIVTGLTKDDFQVYEDGQLQEITNFSADSTLPLTLGILLDTSGSEYFML